MIRIIYLCICVVGITIQNSFVNGACDLPYDELFPFHFTPIQGLTLVCPEGWTMRGSRCYKFYESTLSYHDAKDVCTNKGAKLAVIRELGTNLYVGSLVTDDSEQYWIGEQNEIAVNWLPGNPDTDVSECVAAVNDADAQYPWQSTWCNKGLGFVCERLACADDQFMCLNGDCVHEDFKCDGNNNCGDNSDEQDCPSRTMYFFQGESGEIRSPNYPNHYGNEREVQWVIEAPVGTRLQLKFDYFYTEEGFDFVSVYEGTTTFGDDTKFVGSLSGNLVTNKPKDIISRNNVLIVRFVSDYDGPSANTNRFQISWTTTDIVSNTEVELDDATTSVQSFKSPNYPTGYPSNTKASWGVKSESEWDPVTIMMTEVHLAEGDEVVIYDGKDPSEKPLAHLKGPISWSNSPNFVITSGRYAYIEMDTSSLGGAEGFMFQYKSGCDLVLNYNWGSLQSPGMDYGCDSDEDSRIYGKLQTCTYHIKLPDESLADNRSLTLNFNGTFAVQDDGDILEVFYGPAVSDTVDVSCTSGNSDSCSAPITASNGEVMIRFKSDARNGDASERLGFCVKYSVGCKDPQFSENTNVPDDASYSYTSTFSVSNKEGYYFAQDEFGQCGETIVSGQEVELECQFKGLWNFDRLPYSRAVYCENTPEVDNGYIDLFTKAEFGGRVVYGCFEGFSLQSATNYSECQADGEWSEAPICQAQQCPEVTVENTTSLIKLVVNKDGRDYGSVVLFECMDGYQLTMGHPAILCRSNATWSGPHETGDVLCSKKKCVKPRVMHGTVVGGSMDLAEFEKEVELVCDEGYVIFNTTSDNIDLMCMADETFGEVPTCVNKDECEVDAPCEAPAQCEDTVGSFMCLCPDGYRLNTPTTCEEIDECAEGIHDCYNESYCDNSPAGSYTCTCPTEEGLVLFTEDGMNGFNVRDGETGMKDGDMYHINHTCIPIICADPLNGVPAFGNGTMMVNNKQYFYRGDTVEFLCDLGYGISGIAIDNSPEQTEITCGNDGNWIESIPECVPIECAKLDSQADWINSPRNQPTFWPYASNDNVPYGETVYMNCSVDGREPMEFVRSRKCLYDVDAGRYSIIGDALDCGVIDCGELPTIPGLDDAAYPVKASGETIYGQTFTFTCKTGFNPEGNSSLTNDSVVACRANGHWDLNDLRCIGESCTDPGRPADGYLQIETFEDGQMGRYFCNRMGFTPNIENITCVRAGDGSMKWNADGAEMTPPLPVECEDTERPVFTNCPTQNISVLRYDRVMETIVVTDNSGGLKTVVPVQNVPITEDASFDTIATDYADNQETCTIDVKVINEELPEYPDGCPMSKVYYMDDENTDKTVSVMEEFGVNVTGFGGLPATSIFDPPTFMVNSASLYQTQVLTQTAVEVGRETNKATCTFSVVVMPEVCSTWAFINQEPVHGEATRVNDTYVKVSCDPEYTFYEIEDTELFYTCTPGGFVNDLFDTYIPECVTPTDADFSQVIKMTYSNADAVINQDEKNAYINSILNTLLPAVNTFIEERATECTREGRDVRVNVTIADVDTDIVETVDTLFVSYTVSYIARNNGLLALCESFVSLYFEGINSPIGFPLHEVSAAGEVTLEVTAFEYVVNDYSCPVGQKLKQYEDPNGILLTSCTPCAPGTYYDEMTTNCTKCTLGMYQDEAGQIACKPCPNDTYTYSDGAASVDLCFDECPSPLYSDTRLGPCSACSENNHWVDAASCTGCPADTQTRGPQGPTTPDSCYPKCDLGYFSYDGFGPHCRPCPIGYYSDSVGSDACTACDSDKTTEQMASNHTDLCFTPDTAFCLSYCVNATNCSVESNQIVCTCIDGFTGELCDENIYECASDPCFYGGTCMDEVNGYSCICPSIPRVEIIEHTDKQAGSGGYEPIDPTTAEECKEACRTNEACKFTIFTSNNKCFLKITDGELLDQAGDVTFERFINESNVYGGDRCEGEPNDCPAQGEDGYCENDSGCLDLVEDHRCLCRSNLQFTGETCGDSDPLCGNTVICNNGATCIGESSIYAVCICADGYTGEFCDDDINDCDPNPCLYGAECDDGVNDFTCMCPDGFSGKNCEVRPADLCDGNTCGSKGICVQDYRDSSAQCVCESGYTSDTYYTLWFNEDDPTTGDGDYETLESHGSVCGSDEIAEVECRVVGTMMSSGDKGEVLDVACTTDGGLVCLNVNNSGACSDYEVRYKCQVNGEFCRDINECTMNMCENGATCEDEDNDYSCDCADGYDGYNCQHDIDECLTTSCENGGTCNQFVFYSNCTCPEGFEGSTCATDIDDCAGNPCDVTGTCDDRVDDFYCLCSPGYMGKNCSEEIDECMSEPCYHNGTCIDGINEYTCTCTPGWTGDRCEDMVEYCDDTDCMNGGECFEIFTDSFCSCKPGYSDTDCSEGPKLCEVANPCTNGGTCKVNDDGEVECMCPDEFTGEGCQCQRSYCTGEDAVCQNGECTVFELGSYNCECHPGYTGVNCETNIDDCEGVSCESGVCVDGLDVSFCECEFGKVGANCGKDVNRGFDLEFTQKGESCLLKPFLLNTTDFSLSMWVRVVSTMDVEGVILNLYSAESATSTKTDETILQLTVDGVDFDVDTADDTLDFSKEINDGQWYHVVLTVGDSIKLFVDAASIDYPIAGEMLPEYGLVCLGPATFAGEISLLQIWDHVLSTGTISDLYSAGVRGQDITEEEGLLLDWAWSLYSAGPGVSRQPKTDRANKICRLGQKAVTDDFGSVSCEVDEDVHPPTLLDCPMNIAPKLPEEGARFVTFNGTFNTENIYESGTVSPSNFPEEVFNTGHHEILVTSVDSAGNRGFCRFDVFVRLGDCQHVLPDTASCTEEAGCDLTCSLGGQSHLQDYPDTLQCGPSGMYNTLAPQQKYRLPECGVRRESTDQVVTFEFRYTVDLEVRDSILDSIESSFRTVFSGFDSSSVVSDNFCDNDDCSDVQVTVTNVVEPGQAAIKVVLDCVPDEINNIDTEDIIRQAALQDDTFYLADIGTGASVIPATFNIKTEVCCPNLYQVVDDYCVECPKGTFYNAGTSKCDLCPFGEYQVNPGQTSCDGCGNGKTTETMGSTDANDCIDICQPGYRYSDDDSACVACGLGFYQPDAGQTCCLPCDIGQTTNMANSTSESDCFDTCDDGKELRPDGSCELCPVGTYRQKGVQSKCVQCRENFITPDVGGVTEADCSVRICPAGQFVVGENCSPCPVNTYRSADMDNCTACPEQTRTEGNEKVSVDECIFFCPAGKFVDNSTGTLQCTLCPRDSYKSGDTYDTECSDCPDSTPRTAGMGATSQDDCRFGNCVAGEYVDPDDLQACLKCPLDTYQENPDPVFNVDNCTDCDSGFGTMVEGANSSAMCMKFCESGFELMGEDCVKCARGYYKNNTVRDLAKFDSCTKCDESVITPEEGAVSVDQCSQGNCTAGQYAVGTDCRPCPVGKYSTEKWQTECTPCEDPESTTAEEGADSPDLCNVYPNRTRLIFKIRISVQWEDAYVDLTVTRIADFIIKLLNVLRPIIEKLSLYRSGLNVISATRGSIIFLLETLFDLSNEAAKQLEDALKADELMQALTDAEIPLVEGEDSVVVIESPPVCTEGQTVNDQGQCEDCAVGTYQPMGSTSLCLPCPEGETTADPKSVSVDACIRICPVGQEDDGADGCSECSDNAATEGGIVPCAACTDSQITYNNKSYCGAPCAAGSYSVEGVGTCAECEKGSYNSEENAMMCMECEEGLSTAGTGATNRSDCKNPCELDDDYCNNGQCSYENMEATCSCDEFYFGDRCDRRKDPSETKDNNLHIIIGASIGGVVALILLILLIACCVRASGTEKRSKGYQAQESAGPMMYPAAAPAGFGSSVAGYYPSPSYYPTYTGAPSVLVDPSQGVQNYDNSGYMFYDERSDANGGSSYNPYTMQSYFQR